MRFVLRKEGGGNERCTGTKISEVQDSRFECFASSGHSSWTRDFRYGMIGGFKSASVDFRAAELGRRAPLEGPRPRQMAAD